MPNFIEVKKWIREAAKEIGAYVPECQAKFYAGEFLTSMDPDTFLRTSSLTYSDPTGEKACKEWFKAVAA